MRNVGYKLGAHTLAFHFFIHRVLHTRAYVVKAAAKFAKFGEHIRGINFIIDIPLGYFFTAVFNSLQLHGGKYYKHRYCNRIQTRKKRQKSNCSGRQANSRHKKIKYKHRNADKRDFFNKRKIFENNP